MSVLAEKTLHSKDNLRAQSDQPSTLVFGMGLTGASCARYFAARDIQAEFIDTRESPSGMQAILDAMPRARLRIGAQAEELPDSVERIVLSPGVSLQVPMLVQARVRGIEVVSDIDLFFAECRAPVVAVTGSNGKSTVTAMTGHALRAAGWSTAVGGNIGTPALDLLESSHDAYVLELSSFQLERTRPVPAHAAVLLNVSSDHLDRHRGIGEYARAKARIYAACRHAVVNRDEPGLAQWVPEGTPTTSFGLGTPGPEEFGIRIASGVEQFACGEALLGNVRDLQLAGRHNISNALAALALGSALGAEPRGMVQGLKRFPGLPHRMQTVAQKNGVTWIDDSKATNVAAALASISGVGDPLILIAGGDGKGAEFGPLAAALAGRSSFAILLGKDRARLAEALRDACQVQLVSDMYEAVAAASTRARAGHTVLLAPACSSLDMFHGFEQRGEIFAAAIEEGTR
jgi:UDP-N-acetylmuramoylalanine--D-glutamate ligase